MEWSELGGVHPAAALAVLASALLLLLLGVWPRRSRRTAAPTARQEPEEVHRNLVCVQSELRELVRDMNGQLDAKMQALRNLLHEARCTIEELRQLTGRPATSSSLAAVPSYTPAPSNAGPAASLVRLDAARHNLSRPHAHKPADRSRPDLRHQRYSRIYTLADEGLGASQIATESGLQRGEVELILSLRRKQHHVDPGSRPEPVDDPSEEALV